MSTETYPFYLGGESSSARPGWRHVTAVESPRWKSVPAILLKSSAPSKDINGHTDWVNTHRTIVNACQHHHSSH